MQDIQNNICCMWACTILLGKSIHMFTCSVPWMTSFCSSAGATGLLWCHHPPPPRKGWSNKPLLAGCTPHNALCRMEWHLHNCVDFQSFQNLVFSLFMNPWVELGSITKSQTIGNVRCTLFTCLHTPEVAESSCTTFYISHYWILCILVPDGQPSAWEYKAYYESKRKRKGMWNRSVEQT